MIAAPPPPSPTPPSIRDTPSSKVQVTLAPGPIQVGPERVYRQFPCVCIWSRRTLRPYFNNRSEKLREHHHNRMRRHTTDQSIFFDESIFNQKIGCRHQPYALVSDATYHPQDNSRGDTKTILPPAPLVVGRKKKTKREEQKQ